MNAQKIGELNGKWALLFRITQLVVPILAITAIPWTIWVTTTIHRVELEQTRFNTWMAAGPRFTPVDADNLRLKILSEVRSTLDVRFDAFENKLVALDQSIKRLELSLLSHQLEQQKSNP